MPLRTAGLIADAGAAGRWANIVRAKAPPTAPAVVRWWAAAVVTPTGAQCCNGCCVDGGCT
jgi:hypothetical protein